MIDSRHAQNAGRAAGRRGAGQVIKYGCIADGALFEKKSSGSVRARRSRPLDEIIARCCAIKARYDTRIRTTTAFAYSSTSATRWRTRWKTRWAGVLLHGEAVCIGMVAAAGWGEALGVTPKGTGARIERLPKRMACRPSGDERLTRASGGGDGAG